MVAMRLRASPYWQAYCPRCGRLLGTFKPTCDPRVATCAGCGTEAAVALSKHGFPVCWATAEINPLSGC